MHLINAENKSSSTRVGNEMMYLSDVSNVSASKRQTFIMRLCEVPSIHMNLAR